MNKHILASKTFWFGIVSAFAPLYPPIETYLQGHAVEIGMLWGSISIILRYVTKDKVVLKQ